MLHMEIFYCICCCVWFSISFVKKYMLQYNTFKSHFYALERHLPSFAISQINLLMLAEIYARLLSEIIPWVTKTECYIYLTNDTRSSLVFLLGNHRVRGYK